MSATNFFTASVCKSIIFAPHPSVDCATPAFGTPTVYPNASILPSQRAPDCSDEVSSDVPPKKPVSTPVSYTHLTLPTNREV